MPFTIDTAKLYGSKGGKSFKKRYGTKGLSKNGKRGAKKRWSAKRVLSPSGDNALDSKNG